LRARRLIAAAATASALIAAPPASAATTVGSTFSSGLGCAPNEGILDLDSAYQTPAGVITSWSHNGSPIAPGNAKLIVARPTSAPGQYLVVWLTAAFGFSPGSQSFPTQIPVQAGDVIGLKSVTGIGTCRGLPPFGTTAEQSPGSGDPQMWQVNSFPMTGAGPINVSVTVEPDTDVDGWGDETQDFCPGTFGTNHGCPVSSGGGAGGGGGTPTTPSGPFVDTVAPSIVSMTFVPSVFRVNSAGVARQAPRGSSLRVSLTEPAFLVAVVQRRTIGRRVGGRCLPNTPIRRTAPRCTRYVLVGTFSRALPGKQNSTPFAGRVLRNGVARNLAPGAYKATAITFDAAGNRSRPRAAFFTIVS
jgi:hypothetical protein